MRDEPDTSFIPQINALKNDIEEFKAKSAQMSKVRSIYDNYNKNSFIRLSDITTISKFRIKRVNRYDPSGKNRLTNEQMSSISDELMKLYITK